MADRDLWQTPPATVAEAARVLSDLGWEILPVRKGEKVPAAKEWQLRDFTPEDIPSDGNLGVRLAPPLIDIDFDVPEAAVIGEALLPATLSSGRPSAPRTHYWYLCETPVDYTPFTAPGKERTMLLEVRAGRDRYTLVSPSIHPSGEQLAWNGSRITMIEAETLAKRTALVAALTLVARGWPAGQRHQAAGAVAGWLLGHGIPGELIRAGVRALCQAAKDDEAEDRLRMVETTLDKAERQEPIQGGATLKEILGDAAYTKANGWLKAVWVRPQSKVENDPQLRTLNQTHFVVRVGSKVVVGMEEPDGLVLLPFEEFKRLYFHLPRVGRQKPAEAWLEAEGRRTHDRIVFAPPGAPPHGPANYNLWNGFACSPDIRPEPERYIPRYLEHITDVIADGKAEVADYVLDLLADCVQRPGRPIGKALALRSVQGRGKGVFVENFGRLFGRHFIAVSSREQIVGRFNAHLSGKIVVFADEAVWGGSKDSIGTLKRLVTESTFTIEQKGIDLRTEPNYAHLFLATNEAWTWPAGNYERRGIILDIVKHSTPAYFQKLWAEVQSPEFLPALLAVLLQRAVDTERLRAGLVTEALREQQDYTADPVQSWWHGVVEEGLWSRDGAEAKEPGDWPVFIAGAALYEAFKASMKDAGVGHLGTRRQFERKWLALLPEMSRDQRRVDVRDAYSRQVLHIRARGFVLPSLRRCRDHFDTVTGTARPWTDPAPPELDFEEQETL